MQTLPFDPFILLVLLGAVFVHATYQLSVSVLTLLSSHTIGRRLHNVHLLRLSLWYVAGATIAVALLCLAAIALTAMILPHHYTLMTYVTFTLAPVCALLTVLVYYRRGAGTRLWLPRAVVSYVTDRAKRTRSGSEAMSLGLLTVMAEVPFAVAPLLLVGYALQASGPRQWFELSLLYGICVSLPLLVVALYLSSGHKVSGVQRWREQSKNYLKWTSALTLLILSVYVAGMESGNL
ncbi:MAG TPA: hypothetical protein VF597_00275 [Candidatus Saccharimonadales bacterium]|jgi:hypothetical protein